MKLIVRKLIGTFGTQQMRARCTMAVRAYIKDSKVSQRSNFAEGQSRAKTRISENQMKFTE